MWSSVLVGVASSSQRTATRHSGVNARPVGSWDRRCAPIGLRPPSPGSHCSNGGHNVWHCQRPSGDWLFLHVTCPGIGDRIAQGTARRPFRQDVADGIDPAGDAGILQRALAIFVEVGCRPLQLRPRNGLVLARPLARAAAMVMAVSELLWQDTHPAFWRNATSARCNGGKLLQRAAPEPTAMGRGVGPGLSSRTPARPSASTSVWWPCRFAKSNSVLSRSWR